MLTGEEYTPLPHRTYTIRVISVKKRPRRAGPGIYLSVEMEVYGGEYDGRRIWSYYAAVSPGARYFYRRLLRGAGVRKAAHLPGRHLRVEVVTEDYQGRAFNMVKKVMP